jgi:hypothetical protein
MNNNKKFKSELHIEAMKYYLGILEELRLKKRKIDNRGISLFNYSSNSKNNYWKIITDATYKFEKNLPKILYGYFLLKAKTKYVLFQKISLKENTNFNKMLSKVISINIST